MKYLFILLCIFDFILLTKSNIRHENYCNQTSDQIKLHFLSEPFRVIGKAVGVLSSEKVSIGLTIETLHIEATESLNQNSKILNNSIESLKKLGLNESEFSTAGIQISPSFRQVYNNSTQIYSQEFEGYKVRNSLIISTIQLNFAGKIIDVTIQNGVTNIEYIHYESLEQSIVDIREKLLAQAVQNAHKLAKITLDELNYKIVSVKNIQMINYQPGPINEFPQPRRKVETLTFQPQNTQEVQVDISFIIKEKQKKHESL